MHHDTITIGEAPINDTVSFYGFISQCITIQKLLEKSLSRYCCSQWSYITMHHDTITIGEAPITILFLSMVLYHNASRYKSYLRSPYHDTVSLNGLTSQCIMIQLLLEKPLSMILFLSTVLYHNASRYKSYWRSPYHDTVSLNGLTSQCITIQ